MNKSETTRQEGFYWVRSRNPEYPGLSIAQWSELSNLWGHPGVSATSEDSEIEVVSPRLMEPTGASVQAAVTDRVWLLSKEISDKYGTSMLAGVFFDEESARSAEAGITNRRTSIVQKPAGRLFRKRDWENE